MKIVIVGAVAGGASAAARARRLDESAEIVLLERGPEPSFANCGMPYYIGGEIANRDDLLVAPAELLRGRLRLDLRTRHQVESIDRGRKLIRVLDLQADQEYQESFDRLILSPGAAPHVPDVPGARSPGVYALRNLSDADGILAAVRQATRAVVIGGGFIGVEMVENLVRRGVQTTLIERGDQLLGVWDAEMAAPIADAIRGRGVALHLGDEVSAIDASAGGLRIGLRRGAVVEADLAIWAIGVRPDTTLAVDAGLQIGPSGGIAVTPDMQTSDPDIYAVGDAVEATHFVSGQPTHVPLAGPANRQGRIAADSIFGRASAFRGTQGTAVVGCFGHTAAMTGLTEKACRSLGIEAERVVVHPMNHAAYYPGAERMTLKLLFTPPSGDAPGGRLLGGQAVGGAGVDKRIDVLATAIQAGMTVQDLAETELCYAPQYGSAKDPINMAGFVATGVLSGDHPQAHAGQLPQDAVLLDVRSPREHAAGAIPGALNLPLETLRERLDKAPAAQPLVVYCQVGIRGYLATRLLLQHGRQARNLSGGYLSWLQHKAARELSPQD